MYFTDFDFEDENDDIFVSIEDEEAAADDESEAF